MASLKHNSDTITLNNGLVIPVIGFGTWRATEEGAARRLVRTAIEKGSRHIDTATIYGNEKEVGQGIADGLKSAGLDRKDLFVTTKLWNDKHKLVEQALDASLASLGLDYVDLYLIHWPISLDPATDKPYTDWDFVDTYKVLQKIYKETGKIKAIGVSNFTQKKLERLLADPEVTVVPAVNQIEAHPLLPQWDLYDYLKSKNIHIQAYSPLGSDGAPLLKDKTIVKIAEKNNVLPAHVLVLWGAQRNTVVIVKSSSEERIISNQQTFKLSESEFKELNELAAKEGVRRVGELEWNNFDD